jgi:DNA-binding MarR family transcriptional regulator
MSPQHAAPYLASQEVPPAETRSALLEGVTTRWQVQLRAALLPLELTHAQYRLLVAVAWLAARGGAVRQADIAIQANADPVMTSEVLRTLESRGLITRGPHPTDGRARAISPTEAGGALADRAARLVAMVETRFFETGMPQFAPLAKALKKGGRGAATPGSEATTIVRT